jgi:hypothetical protein
MIKILLLVSGHSPFDPRTHQICWYLFLFSFSPFLSSCSISTLPRKHLHSKNTFSLHPLFNPLYLISLHKYLRYYKLFSLFIHLILLFSSPTLINNPLLHLDPLKPTSFNSELCLAIGLFFYFSKSVKITLYLSCCNAITYRIKSTLTLYSSLALINCIPVLPKFSFSLLVS